jgi:hypothetical protein
VRREIFDKIITKLYPNQNIMVVDYRLMTRDELNENGEWVPCRPTIFVEVKCDDFDNKGIDLTDYLTKLTGFEFVVDKV